MGGSSWGADCEFIIPRTLVLVGKTGSGKSATGNTILGMKVLRSKRSSSGVTVSSEMQAIRLEDGQMLNVIDTPGLFDPSLDFEFIGKEIVKCINMAQNGIDAFLVVVSTLTRFSEEEKAAISSLQTLFGGKVYDYMILVFTGGDQLEEDDQTLDDFLCDIPEGLKETLGLCGNRYLLFDNKTKDEIKRSNQVKELLLLVNMVSTMNGGKPFTSEIFTEMKNQMKGLKEQEISEQDERFKHMYEYVESKLKETTSNLGQQLAACVKEENVEKRNKEIQQEKKKLQTKEEHAACVNAEKKTKAAKKPDKVKELQKKEDCVDSGKKPNAAKKKNQDEEIRMLKEKLLKEEKKNKALRQQKDNELRQKEAHWRQREEDLRRSWMGCSIM